MAGFDRSRISLGRRTQQQTDTRESGGGIRRKSFMNYSNSDLKFFKMADVGKYHDLNILPWRIATKNHPEVKAGNSKVGDYDYVLDLMVHTRIGPDNGDYLCLKKNFGMDCPCCEHAEELYKNEKTKEEAKNLFAKRKCVYLVQELDENFHAKSEEPEIMEISHAIFSQELQSRATACLRGKGVVNFADPGTEGRVVSFSVNEGTMGNGRKFKKAGNFEFNDRVEEISDEILEKCPSLDTMMVIPTYAQLKAAIAGDPENVDDDFEAQQEELNTETSTRETRTAPARFTDNTPARFEQDDETPTRSRTRVDGPRPAHPENSENAYEAARRNSRRNVEASETSKDDEPIEDTASMPFDEEPTQETRAPSRGDSKDECPHGYEYGADCDNMPMCSKCPDAVWAKCNACKQRNRGR